MSETKMSSLSDQSTALRAGYATNAAVISKLVVPFRQRGGVRQSHPLVSYGMCVGYSAEWIMRHKTHKSEGAQARIRYLAAQARASSENAQFAYRRVLAKTKETFDGKGQTQSINAAFEYLDCPLRVQSNSFINNVAAAPDDAFRALFAGTAGVHKYYIVILSFGGATDGDAHATAAYHSGGRWYSTSSNFYYFDPNFGEFKMTASAPELRSLFTGLALCYRNYVTKEGVVSAKELTGIGVMKLG